jgi:hypothetical protein
MDRCPELLDLEVFFGCAAASRYGNDGGWYYDHLTFRRVSRDEVTTFTIEPAEGAVSVAHIHKGSEVLSISLQHVVAIDIESSAGVQVLVGRVATPKLEQLFKLHLAPEFGFSLVTSLPTFG